MVRKNVITPKPREIDMIITKMVTVRQKIAYGGDIATIYKERGEKWAQLALEAGHRSVVAVPLHFLDQVTGAILLYSDQMKQISSRDTLLLSIVAQQAALAIQNALSTQELKMLKAGKAHS